MELIEMIIIVLQITAAMAKKKNRRGDIDMAQFNANSDESIENLLYYKDCKHKNKDQPSPMPLRLAVTEAPPPKNPCPCPRMCCSMCCDCNAPMSFVGRQMEPLQTAVEPQQVVPQQPPLRPPQQIMAQQPHIMQRAGKKKKPKMAPKPPDVMSQPPVGGRRDFGFTRENIKSLISRDQDIKKILKDLVRVTMHKVDLVEHVNARRKAETKPGTTQSPRKEEPEDDYYYND